MFQLYVLKVIIVSCSSREPYAETAYLLLRQKEREKGITKPSKQQTSFTRKKQAKLNNNVIEPQSVALRARTIADKGKFATHCSLSAL
jgi:hypothetical protein